MVSQVEKDPRVILLMMYDPSPLMGGKITE